MPEHVASPKPLMSEPLWHALTVEQVLSRLEVTAQGLTPSEAERRQKIFGPNVIPDKKLPSSLTIFLRQLTSPLVLILIIISTVEILLRKYVDSGVILSIVIVNSTIGFIHERRAERSIAALRRMLTPKARVRRSGRIIEVLIHELVPGDILLLSQGDRVPADARLIEEKVLTVNESLLTGESVLERKEAKTLPSNHLPIPDRKNMLYAGTLIQAGTAEAVVVSTGPLTELGKIAEAVKEAQEPPSLFEERLKILSRWLIVGIAAISLGFFVVGVIKQVPALTMFLTAAAMAVSVIPAGLPMVVTLALAAGVTRMAGRKTIVRRLPAVETLGTITTICTDKTGTLTENKMTVRNIVTPRHRYTVTGLGFDRRGEILEEGKMVDSDHRPDLLHILTAASLANDAQVEPPVGDHTEVALLFAAAKAGLGQESLTANFPRLDVIPFDSTLGFMATLHQRKDGNMIFVKGAPEVIVPRCRLSRADQRRILFDTDRFAQDALRVLAVATKTVGKDTTLSPDEVRELSFLGLLAMEDPPREEARLAVEKAGTAGIRVIMLTGDNLHTARSIAKRVGIPVGEKEAIDGGTLDFLDDLTLRHIVGQAHVFARVSPLDKLRIVKALKSRGEIVAVTGDGINDAPALSQSDIGVAMGQEGTDVAREASKIVLTDDNFASIVAAVEEGRTIYNNVQRVVLYLLSTSLGEVLAIISGFLLGLPLLLLPLQILWINFVTDGFAGLPLALEPKKEGVMLHPPRDPKETIITREMLIRIVLVGIVMAVGGILLFTRSLPEGIETAQTIAFVFLSTVQLFNILNVRSKFDSVFKMSLFSNRFLLPSLLVAFLMMTLVIYTPGIREVFQFTPLSLPQFLTAFLFASAVIAVMEARKLLFNLKQPHQRTIEAYRGAM